MFKSKSIVCAYGSFVIASMFLAACQPAATPTPVTITETIIETVVVTEVVEGDPDEVIQVVTATLEPVEEGERTLVICLGQQPSSLYIYDAPILATDQINQAIYDGPIDNRSFSYQPIILEKLPNLADGDAVINVIPVTAGDTVLDIDGNIVKLIEGTLIRPTGCRSSECAVAFDGGELEMEQMTVTFTLLPDLTWSDGTPLKAHDSVYSFELALDPDTPSPSRYVEDRTASYEALDDLTTVWTGLPGYMDSTYFVNYWQPLPEHVLGQYSPAELLKAEEASRTPLGWGPYIIDEWVLGEFVRLHKNPKYWRASEGLPNFDNLIFRFVGENPNANIAALLAGECDVVDQTSHLDEQSELLLELQSSGKLNPTFVTGTTWEHVDFNIQPLGEGYFAAWDTDGDSIGPFGDVRLRQSFAMCMDRESVVKTVMFGQSVVVHTYLPPNHPLFNLEVKQWPYDVEAASALLEEAGWIDQDGNPATPRLAFGVTGVPDGTPLEFNLDTTPATQRQQATQIMAESAAACGIKINLVYSPFTACIEKFLARRFDIGQFAWATGVRPPCDLYIGGSQIPSEENGWSGQNITGYDNPAYNQVCNAAIQTLPGQEGYEEYHQEAQRIFAEELPVVPLYLRLKVAATRPDMCGHIMDPTANSEMWNIEEFDYGDCVDN